MVLLTSAASRMSLAASYPEKLARRISFCLKNLKGSFAKEQYGCVFKFLLNFYLKDALYKKLLASLGGGV